MKISFIIILARLLTQSLIYAEETNLETDVKEKTNTSQIILQQQKRLDLQTTTSFLDSDLVDNSQQILSKVDLTSKVTATSHQEKHSFTELSSTVQRREA